MSGQQWQCDCTSVDGSTGIVAVRVGQARGGLDEKCAESVPFVR